MKKMNKRLKRVIEGLLDQIENAETANEAMALSVAVLNLRNSIVDTSEYL